MRIAFSVMILLTVLVSAQNVVAVPTGKVLSWETGADMVVFDGGVHASKGLTCMDCHRGLFETRKGAAAMKMKDIYEGKHCGKCHDGSRAFRAGAPENCSKCHQKHVR